MPIDQTLDLCLKSFLLFLLRLYNFIVNKFQWVRLHCGRISQAISNEYTPDIYYFFEGESVPYISKTRLTLEEYPTLEWEYDTVKKQYTCIQAQQEDPEIHKFQFLCVDVKKGDEVDCVIGFFKDISWRFSTQPPRPEILLRTYGLEQSVCIHTGGLRFEITDARGTVHTFMLDTQEGLDTWKAFFVA
jgi:hypothetical protein